MRLLVVYDEDGLLSAVSAGPSRVGYAVDTTLTGAAAVAKLATPEYDLMVPDVTLPDTDGFGLCHQVPHGEWPPTAAACGGQRATGSDG